MAVDSLVSPRQSPLVASCKIPNPWRRQPSHRHHCSPSRPPVYSIQQISPSRCSARSPAPAPAALALTRPVPLAPNSEASRESGGGSIEGSCSLRAQPPPFLIYILLARGNAHLQH